MNLKSNRGIQSKVRLLEIKGKEVKDQETTKENFYQFYENVFPNDVFVSNKSISNYLKDISLPKFSMEQRTLCRGWTYQKGGEKYTK